MCLQNDLGIPTENVEDTPAITNFDRMNQRISKEINFYISWVDRFQGNIRPFYEKIYLNTRKKLFDCFGKDIDVGLLGVQVGVFHHQSFHALVRPERGGFVQVKAAYRRGSGT